MFVVYLLRNLTLCVLLASTLLADDTTKPTSTKSTSTVSSTEAHRNATTESGDGTANYDQHSPVVLPVWSQIVILHLIAGLLALIFYLLREYVISQLNQKAVENPTRMTHRRKQKSPD